jgi:Tol biopolymer transport system component
MTAQVLYRSNRHFDWAGNVAWSPDGTRIAVRTKDGVVEISAEDGDSSPGTRRIAATPVG